MSLAFRLSTELGLCPASESRRAIAHLAAIGLPTALADAGLAGRADRLVHWMTGDKKNVPGRLTLVLTHGIGRAFVDRSIDGQRVAAFLASAA
jgi:3-dehydroquinate synthetase